MEVDLFGSAILAFQNIVSLERLGFLSFGVLIGLMLGVIPGLGGLVGLSLLLPFTFSMDPYTALAFMMGLQVLFQRSCSECREQWDQRQLFLMDIQWLEKVRQAEHSVPHSLLR